MSRIPVNPQPWMAHGACHQYVAAGMAYYDDWAAIEGRTEVVARRRARLICADCKVRDLCAKWADENDEQNMICGGMTPDERKGDPKAVETAERDAAQVLAGMDYLAGVAVRRLRLTYNTGDDVTKRVARDLSKLPRSQWPGAKVYREEKSA